VCRRRGPSLDKTAQTRQITEAALAIFLEQGITRATMAQIAARAGVAKGTIYTPTPPRRPAARRGAAGPGQSAAYQPLCRRPAKPPRPAAPQSAADHGGHRAQRPWELARLILTEAKQRPNGAADKELAFDPGRHVRHLAAGL
jgi:hypothetical protein